MPLPPLLSTCAHARTHRAFAAWVGANNGAHGAQSAACGKSEARALAAAVRLPFLGPSFLSFVVMQHGWFRCAVDPVALARAGAYAGASSSVRKDLVAHIEAQPAAGSGSSSSGGGAAPGAGGVACEVAAGGTSVPGGGPTAAAVLRSRAASTKRACSFDWSLDLGAVKVCGGCRLAWYVWLSARLACFGRVLERLGGGEGVYIEVGAGERGGNLVAGPRRYVYLPPLPLPPCTGPVRRRGRRWHARLQDPALSQPLPCGV